MMSLIFVLLASVAPVASVASVASVAPIAPIASIAQAAAPAGPVDLVREAVAARFGAGADVSVTLAGVPDDAPAIRRVSIDPMARTGKPCVVTLYPVSGRAMAVTATIHVVVEHAALAHPVERGHAIEAADIDVRRGEAVDVPLRPLPTASQIAGGRALRPMPAGAIVLSGFVLTRRAIEPGDEITAILATGAVEITAVLVAADGGRVGDVIRVVNPGTKRMLKARVKDGRTVEVIYGR
jgi:flagella basal body P-ring formation protein FlgA